MNDNTVSIHWNSERLDSILADLGKMRPVGSTGLVSLDSMLGGGLCPQVYVLAAEPAAGKTTLALQMADQIALTGTRKALFVSLEMSAAQVVAKSISRVSATSLGAPLSFSDLVADFARFERLSDRARSLVTEAVEVYREQYAPNIATVDEPMSVKDIRDMYAGMPGTELPPVLFVDYLQLMPSAQSAETTTDYQHHTENMRGLAQISKEFNVPVVVISSKNRSGRRGKDMAALAGSSEIEYSAGCVMFLDIDAENEEERETLKAEAVRPVELAIVKNRFGARGSVRLEFRAAENRFVEAG